MPNSQIESYTANTIFRLTNRDLMLDLDGSIYSSFEASPGHIYRTVKKLDESYEGGFPDSWETEYILESDHVFAILSKNYGEASEFAERNPVTLDPSHKIIVSPVSERELEIEVSGVMDIEPEEFLALVNQ